MSTGIRSVHRGFDFATEEGGPAMRRLQSNLSGVRPADTADETPRRKHSFSIKSLKQSLRRKRPPTSSSAKNNKL
jgi:phospholipid-translocating ATPase